MKKKNFLQLTSSRIFMINNFLATLITIGVFMNVNKWGQIIGSIYGVAMFACSIEFLCNLQNLIESNEILRRKLYEKAHGSDIHKG